MPFPTQSACHSFFLRVIVPALCFAAFPALAQPAHHTTFEVAFPSTLHAAPVTGRMFVFIAKNNNAEPRHQIFNGSSGFAVNVAAHRAGATDTIDPSTPGFPPPTLKDIPAADYYVPAPL